MGPGVMMCMSHGAWGRATSWREQFWQRLTVEMAGRTGQVDDDDAALARALADMEGSLWGTENERTREREHAERRPRSDAVPSDFLSQLLHPLQAPPSARLDAGGNATRCVLPDEDSKLARRLQEAEMRGSGLPHTALCNSELFSSFPMLYVRGCITGTAVEFFVDTGAQSSVMSECMAKHVQLMHKVDKNIHGQVHGVGTAAIAGLLVDVPVQIGSEGVEFSMAFMVLRTEQPLLIMGLDQIRKYRCIVDLDHNQLIFGGHGGIAVDFVQRPMLQTGSGPLQRQQECTVS